MQKFLALYRVPVVGLEAWMQVDEATRKEEESKLQAKWDTWAAANAASILETAAAGKTKRVTTQGTEDVKNDIMIYSLVQADSAESAAKIFEGHPHLEIPDATIDVMPATLLSEMQ